MVSANLYSDFKMELRLRCFYLLLFGMAHVQMSPIVIHYAGFKVTGSYKVLIGLTTEDTVSLCFTFSPRILKFKVRFLNFDQIYLKGHSRLVLSQESADLHKDH